MDKIKELITVIQVVAGAGAMTRVVYYILAHINDDDFTTRNKKIKNVLIAVILIETALYIANVIKGYYQ